jgi:hypothetical protein
MEEVRRFLVMTGFTGLFQRDNGEFFGIGKGLRPGTVTKNQQEYDL